jgi:hypothetical protein
MLGDRRVNDPSTVVREDDEYEEQSEGDRRHDEEVGGHDLARVICQRRSPRLGRGTQMPSHVLGHSRLDHRDPQLQELPVNPRRTPERDWPTTAHGSWPERLVVHPDALCGIGFSTSSRGDATR